jgi:hypothetical protein
VERTGAAQRKLDARVLTNIKVARGVPTDHPLHAAPPANRRPGEAKRKLITGRGLHPVRSTGSIPRGTLKQAFATRR